MYFATFIIATYLSIQCVSIHAVIGFQVILSIKISSPADIGWVSSILLKHI